MDELIAMLREPDEEGSPLEVSLDADLIVDPVDQGIADMLKDAIGVDSGFMQMNGYYANILRPTISETLPAGWEDRLQTATV